MDGESARLKTPVNFRTMAHDHDIHNFGDIINFVNCAIIAVADA